jgi:hypothetical protein
MENRGTKLPNTSKQPFPIDEPEIANKQSANKDLPPEVVGNIPPKLGKKRHILRNVLLSIAGLVIVIVIIGTLIIISIAKDITKPNNPAGVQAAYTQTANKTATQVISGTSGPISFSKQSLPPDKSIGKTNEVNTLYCYTVNNNANVVNEINQGFPQSDPWTYVGQANGTVAAISSLLSTLQQTGTINLRYETQKDKLSTNNPNYNAAAVAYATVSLPLLSNQCTTPAKQDKVNTTGKLIVALQLDLFDYPSGKTVIIWQSPTNGVEYQTLINELSLLGLTNMDKQTYLNVTSQKEIYFSDPDYGFGDYSQVGEGIDLCLSGNENPAVALTAIDSAFNNNGWQADYVGNNNIPYIVNAIHSKQSLEGFSLSYTKSSNLGQISATFNPDGTFYDGSPQCSLGSYTHAFSINLSYSSSSDTS